MLKFKIELPEKFAFTRQGQTFEVDPSKFNESIIAQLVMHGVTQKIGDSAAGKHDDEAIAAMQATYDTLADGDWGKGRSGGAGEPAHYRFVRQYLRSILSARKDEYKALAPEDRNDWLMAIFDGFDADTKASIDQIGLDLWEVDREAKRAAKAKASTVTVEGL